MQANQTTLQQIIEGCKQYVVPLFQRRYSWTTKQWETLWLDLMELYDANDEHSHFLGSLVTMPTSMQRDGSVTQFLLIDGQQRLITLFVVLAALRDVVREKDVKLFHAIHQMLLVNFFEQGDNYYKLLPTQANRSAFCQILLTEEEGQIDDLKEDESKDIIDCYSFFYKRIKSCGIPGSQLRDIICTRLSLVKIDLEGDDDPYLVFESLNAKGEPLTQADLIRNFIFMKVPKAEQNGVYSTLWKPMEDLLKKDLTEFIRHYLCRNGDDIRKGNVYSELKRRVQSSDPHTALQDLVKFSRYYSKILKPEQEENALIRECLARIRRLEVTTLYPFLLNCYDDLASQKVLDKEFIEILKTLENFILRRFIADIKTQGLNRVFVRLYSSVTKQKELSMTPFVDCLKSILQTQNYPTDIEFEAGLKGTSLYGSNRSEKGRLILEAIEKSFGHKETVVLDKLSIEHIMPQKLTKEWQDMLGDDADSDHELLKHTLGNLTLTAYNSEMSNAPFTVKKRHYVDSHLELNKYFLDLDLWTRKEIEQRSSLLSYIALKIWPYFGDQILAKRIKSGFTGSKPTGLKIMGREYQIKTWRDVLEQTLNAIYQQEPEKFILIRDSFGFISDVPDSFRSSRQLESGDFIEVNWSAQNIYELCIKSLNIASISQDEWTINIE